MTYNNQVKHKESLMTQRIKIADLKYLCTRLNEETSSPLKPWTRDENGRNRANIGNYHLSQAYGGVQLHRMHNEGGGVTCPIPMGYETKRDAYNMIQSYLYGVEA